MLPLANMKIIPSHKQSLVQSSVSVGLVLAAGILIFTGCGKAKKSAAEGPAPTPAQVKQTETDHMPAPARIPVTPGVVTQPNGEPDLAELNRSLLRWILGHRRRPNNFEDFAATAGVTIPPPPAGKKYFLASNMHIELVSR